MPLGAQGPGDGDDVHPDHDLCSEVTARAHRQGFDEATVHEEPVPPPEGREDPGDGGRGPQGVHQGPLPQHDRLPRVDVACHRREGNGEVLDPDVPEGGAEVAAQPAARAQPGAGEGGEEAPHHLGEVRVQPLFLDPLRR